MPLGQSAAFVCGNISAYQYSRHDPEATFGQCAAVGIVGAAGGAVSAVIGVRLLPFILLSGMTVYPGYLLAKYLEKEDDVEAEEVDL